ncbi:Predicted protein [Natronincola peptidivorans]|uniref:Copper amine oxidase N-terminal domain-containing protein n=1 Tax=Natronincola peptidivorans TaxID=426128 RepID=A0A1H9ZUZ4_9FIRM|nr:phosphodiester glycosidase family protein [Natronincola peptidivorans]SES85119.1 Predicted protein [Natronincola peptidivorans]
MIRKTNLVLIVIAILILSTTSVFASNPYAYTSSSINGFNVNHITLDMNDTTMKSVVLNANNELTATQSLAEMAKTANAVAAINGTYFEAYGGTPVPWGTIIKDKKVLHIGNSGSVVGITEDNRLIIDNLTINFEGYINGEYRAIPWRINHPSTEPEAITIFTPEYKQELQVQAGTKTVLVTNGVVTSITEGNFRSPTNGFAISYNPSVAYLVDERYKIGDKVEYKHVFVTKHTKPEDWDKVVNAIGAGPSLIINGQVTADGLQEGFWEEKINTNKAGRSFIGSTRDGKIVIGTIPNATLREAAAICQSLNLVNAMCLDGGWSSALYYKDRGGIVQGRNINNGLGFIKTGIEPKVEAKVAPTEISINIDGKKVHFTDSTGRPYIDRNGRTLVPLKVTMEGAGAEVSWNGREQTAIVEKDGISIAVIIGEAYITVNDEKIKNDTVAVINNNKTYLPIKAVLESLGYTVTWDNNTRTVHVVSINEGLQ